MRFQWLCLRVVLPLLLAGSVAAQRAPRQFSITGQVVIPPPFAAESFEIRLLQEGGRPFGQTLSSDGGFRFERLPEGTYFIVVNLPGFEAVNQQVSARGPVEEVIANIVLSPREKTKAVVESLDLSGEPDNVVDVVDLQKEGSAELLDELARAKQELKEGKPAQARNRLQTLVEKVPDFYEARKLLGTAYQQLGRFREAEAEFNAARRLRPESASPLLNLGSLYLQEVEAGAAGGTAPVGQLLKQAVENLQAAVTINPAAAFGHYLLGIAFYKLNSFEDAENRLKRALNLEPRLGHARLALANLYIRTQDWGSALSQLDAYLKEHPEASDRDQIAAVRSRIESLLARAAGG